MGPIICRHCRWRDRVNMNWARQRNGIGEIYQNRKFWNFVFWVGGLWLVRIDPSRRGGINETRGKFWEYTKIQKWPPSWKNLEKRQKTYFIVFFIYNIYGVGGMGAALFWGSLLELTSSWPPARVEGRSRAAAPATWSGGSADSGDEFQTYDSVQSGLNEIGFVALRCNVFLTFSWRLRLKHLVLRPFLTNRLTNMVSKSMVSRETSLKKSKKRQAIALAARGGCGGLGQLCC